MQAATIVTDLPQVRERRLKTFENLALPLWQNLYRAALKLTRNDADAEDLVQDTYLRGLRFHHQFREGTNFRAWFFTMLKNVFIDRCRKNRREPASFGLECIENAAEDDYGSDELERYVSSGGETEIEDLFDDDLQQALDSLPHDFRRVVLLADVGGFNYREIAQILDCPIGTVRSRICRGRQRLKEILQSVAA